MIRGLSILLSRGRFPEASATYAGASLISPTSKKEKGRECRTLEKAPAIGGINKSRKSRSEIIPIAEHPSRFLRSLVSKRKD